MRKILIERLHWHIQFHPSAARYHAASVFLADKMGGMQKFGKSGLKKFTVVHMSEEMNTAINQLSDTDLVELFELVVRAFSKQM